MSYCKGSKWKRRKSFNRPQLLVYLNEVQHLFICIYIEYDQYVYLYVCVYIYMYRDIHITVDSYMYYSILCVYLYKILQLSIVFLWHQVSKSLRQRPPQGATTRKDHQQWHVHQPFLGAHNEVSYTLCWMFILYHDIYIIIYIWCMYIYIYRYICIDEFTSVLLFAYVYYKVKYGYSII